MRAGTKEEQKPWKADFEMFSLPYGN